MSNGGDDTDDIIVDRSCIGCDNCGVGSPQKCCARCGSDYYCSKECQVQHWKQHKPVCTELKKWHDMWKDARDLRDLPDGTPLDTKEGPCAICLEETITNPVVLPCGHAFCFECVVGYQCSSNSKEASCPYCRGEIPDVIDKASDRMMLYLERATVSSKGSEEQKKYAKLALAEIESIIKLFDPDKEKVAYMKMLHTNVMMLSMLDRPEETIKMTKELLSLNEKYPGILSFDDVMRTKNWQAEAYAALGRWKDAVKIYECLRVSYVQHNELPEPDFIVGCCEAMYQTRGYDMVIKVGNIGIDMMRYWPGIHKYVALSQKAKGDIDGAKLTMSRAILYEYHWDKDNLQMNKQLLRELKDL